MALHMNHCNKIKITFTIYGFFPKCIYTFMCLLYNILNNHKENNIFYQIQKLHLLVFYIS